MGGGAATPAHNPPRHPRARAFWKKRPPPRSTQDKTAELPQGRPSSPGATELPRGPRSSPEGHGSDLPASTPPRIDSTMPALYKFLRTLNGNGMAAARAFKHALRKRGSGRLGLASDTVMITVFGVSATFFESLRLVCSINAMTGDKVLEMIKAIGTAIEPGASVAANYDNAHHWTRKYNVLNWIKYSRIYESAANLDKIFEICEIKMLDVQNPSIRRVAELGTTNVSFVCADINKLDDSAELREAKER